uniref:Uncharacterized protein K02A2.6 n=1 Tax=Caenorhabditis elegans TaxID=6239 RepID=YRD6_CAEEL|nr:RecName: Full=Uncharacterized protein K02A2.6 [Caenorhabditis elegans]
MNDLKRSIQKFQFNVAEPEAFKRWLARNKLTFVEDGKNLSERERTRLLLGCLEESTFHRYEDSQREISDIYSISFDDTVTALTKIFGSTKSLMMRRQQCLQICRANGLSQDYLDYTNSISDAVLDSKLSSMTSDEWSIFLFLRGLNSPGDEKAKLYLMQYVEASEKKNEKLKLSDVHDEWMKFIQMHQQSKIVSVKPSKSSQQVDVNKVDTNRSKKKKKPIPRKPEKSSQDSKKKGEIPTCFYCNKKGHYATNCRSNPKTGNQGGNKGKSKGCDSVHVDGLDVKTEHQAKHRMSVEVCGKDVAFQLDTGSMITLISVKCWEKLGSPPLEKVPHRISCANGTPMAVKGRCLVKFKLKGIEYTEYVYVRDRQTNLLGTSWLNLCPQMRSALAQIVNQVSTSETEASRLEVMLKNDFPEVFKDGLGLCTKEKAEFRTEENAVPVFKRARPVPYGSLEAVETELNRLQEMGVIVPITYAKWAAPIVVIKKKGTGKIRVCADFKCSGLNAALKDEFHPLPTSEDIFSRLKGTVYSQIDLKDAYLQVELDEEAQKLAVINTHRGIFKYLRMTFGLKPAPASFQKIMDKMVSGLTGVAVYWDDIIISASSIEEHEKILRELFERFKEYGFRVSAEKCAFAQKQVTFLGFVDEHGRRPDSKKTEAIRSMKAPTDQKQLASFLGAADWLSRMMQDHQQNADDVVIAEIYDDDDDEDDSIIQKLNPVTETDIRFESQKDHEVSSVVKLVRNDSWKPKPSTEIEKHWIRYRDRLKLIHGCLLLDDRVIVPKSLQKIVLKQLHEGHPGIVQMKQKARSFVFWRGLDSDIENMVRHCNNCQENSKMPRVVPLNPWPVPEAPWKRIHIDFAGPLNGCYLLVVVDAKTKYAEVKLTRSISAVTTIDLLEEIFSIHGYPETIISDNGTQLTSHLFAQMCQSHGIEHKTSAVYYPRSNGAAERFVDTLKRGIAKIKGEGSVNQQILNKFLISYRNTPHSALNGSTPAECHFGRKIRTTMSLLMPTDRVLKVPKLTQYQQNMKHHYELRNGARAKAFQVNQKVYVQVHHGNKSQWKHGVIRRKFGGVLYEVQVGDRMQKSHVNQIRTRYGDYSRSSVNPRLSSDPLGFVGESGGDEMSRNDDPVVTSNGSSTDVNRGSRITSELKKKESNAVRGQPCGSCSPTNNDVSAPGYASRSHPTTDPSHSVRRSSRIRRVLDRYGSSVEHPSTSTGTPRGSTSTQLGQASTRNGSRYTASGRNPSCQGNRYSSIRGEGVTARRERVRTTWR